MKKILRNAIKGDGNSRMSVTEFRYNFEYLDCLKELNCIYDISGISTPEMRLLLCVLMTGMNCHNTNKFKKNFDQYLDQPIEEELKEKYEKL